MSTLAKVVASTIQTDKPETLTKYMEQLNELSIETAAEKKFKEEAPVSNVMAAGSAEKLMSFFGSDVTVEINEDAEDGMRVLANYAGVEYIDEEGPQPL